MNPKEKAKEIYLKMLNETFEHNDIKECEHTAKLCALIAVDEILKVGNVIISYNATDYWQEVKTEIENL